MPKGISGTAQMDLRRDAARSRPKDLYGSAWKFRVDKPVHETGQCCRPTNLEPQKQRRSQEVCPNHPVLHENICGAQHNARVGGGGGKHYNRFPLKANTPLPINTGHTIFVAEGNWGSTGLPLLSLSKWAPPPFHNTKTGKIAISEKPI